MGKALLRMACPADRAFRLLEQTLVLRVMGEMAAQAVADRRGAMGIGSLDEVRMTDGTELLRRNDEAGVGVLVVTVVAALFRIGGMDRGFSLLFAQGEVLPTLCSVIDFQL